MSQQWSCGCSEGWVCFLSLMRSPLELSGSPICLGEMNETLLRSLFQFLFPLGNFIINRINCILTLKYLRICLGDENMLYIFIVILLKKTFIIPEIWMVVSSGSCLMDEPLSSDEVLMLLSDIFNFLFLAGCQDAASYVVAGDLSVVAVHYGGLDSDF